MRQLLSAMSPTGQHGGHQDLTGTTRHHE